MHEAIKITPRSCFAHLGAPVLYNVGAHCYVPYSDSVPALRLVACRKRSRDEHEKPLTSPLKRFGSQKIFQPLTCGFAGDLGFLDKFLEVQRDTIVING